MLLNRKPAIIALVMITLIVVCSQDHFANAELRPDNNYVIYEKGYDIKNTSYALDLQIHVGSDKSGMMPISLVEGLLSHDGKYFVASENWKGIIMKSDNLMMLSGNAVGANGTTISVTLLGKQINNTQNGAIYRLAGNIRYDNQRTGFINVVEIENVRLLTSEKISKEMPHVVINQNIQ